MFFWRSIDSFYCLNTHRIAGTEAIIEEKNGEYPFNLIMYILAWTEGDTKDFEFIKENNNETDILTRIEQLPAYAEDWALPYERNSDKIRKNIEILLTVFREKRLSYQGLTKRSLYWKITEAKEFIGWTPALRNFIVYGEPDFQWDEDKEFFDKSDLIGEHSHLMMPLHRPNRWYSYTLSLTDHDLSMFELKYVSSVASKKLYGKYAHGVGKLETLDDLMMTNPSDIQKNFRLKEGEFDHLLNDLKKFKIGLFAEDNSSWEFNGCRLSRPIFWSSNYVFNVFDLEIKDLEIHSKFKKAIIESNRGFETIGDLISRPPKTLLLINGIDPLILERGAKSLRQFGISLSEDQTAWTIKTTY